VEFERIDSRSPIVSMLALAALGSGLVNLVSLTQPDVPRRVALLRTVFPLEFLQLSRLLTCLLGLALVVAAIHIYKRKARALQVVAALSVCSVVFHLTKGIDYEEALCSIALLGLLFVCRREFSVRSATPDWRGASLGFGAVLATLICYRLGESLVLHLPREAMRLAASTQITAAAAAMYATVSAFRPAPHRQSNAPEQRAKALRLIDGHGRSNLDFFKVWPRKSLFFGPSRESFLAYDVAAGMAVVLGDPVGPAWEIGMLVRAFALECRRNDWSMAFYQTLPDFLPAYAELGLKRLKIGDDAIVDLTAFSLDGAARKSLRTGLRKLEAAGIHYEHHDPPIPDALLDEMQVVSDEWLSLPGRRERHFALGHFDRDYLRTTPTAVARDADGRMIAFVNVLVSRRRLEATGDLMRRLKSAPNGVMDYLFIRTFVLYRERGLVRFSLGMAPMSGFTPAEAASPEARAVHVFFQHLGFLFSFRGLRAYKAKFATSWEPRYVVYSHVLDLPRLGIAVARLSGARPAME
jgi:phosphatidylglycerol lysyltransferase